MRSVSKHLPWNRICAPLHMKILKNHIEIIAAPSILGLKPNGVELLPEALIHAGLEKQLQTDIPVQYLPTLNALYSKERDPGTGCLNPDTLRQFSIELGEVIAATADRNHFAFVLGGDCSILLGIMSGLKTRGTYGLVFIDAHADFYEPSKSPTGEVADMDLGFVTGRGPARLTNINNAQPYVKDQHVIHVAQRDAAEAAHYGSRDIRDTSIRIYDMELIGHKGIETVATNIIADINNWKVDGYWLHFDTDSLADEINPAVEYHLPGGLSFEQAAYLINQLLRTGNMAGISVTIFNPRMDPDGHIANNITQMLIRAFSAG